MERELDGSAVAAGAQAAVAALDGRDGPAEALDAAAAALHEAVPGLLPSIFVLEHGRLWLVAQHGYAAVPDGISIERGVTGRAVRHGHAQLVQDVSSDRDYVGALPGVSSELAVPLHAEGEVVGVLNVESEYALPESAAGALEPLAAALAPLVQVLSDGRMLDLPALARLFAHISSVRDADEIAALAAASLPRVLPVEASQVFLWNEAGEPNELASWQAHPTGPAPLSAAELVRTRAQVQPTIVCQVLGPAAGLAPIVWLPLRANAEELGALVGVGRSVARVDPSQLDTSAVLAAHVAASLDAAVALQRERESAVTDSLTGVLNRRGLEERLERELAEAKARRTPMSVLVIDCDDLKEINDRAGHEFGDALLREVAGVLTQALPEGAGAARLGGDEFVVTLPDAGTDLAEALGERIRAILADGLTEAGFPLRISAGISTYPFDGAGSTALLRAADQALYAAKDAGKDRIASFQDVVRGDRPEQPQPAGERRARPPADGSVLRDAMAAVEAIEAETTTEGVCNRLCKALVFVVGATACSASRIDGDLLVDLTAHALRDVSLGRPATYRIADFPVTAEVLASSEPRVMSFADGDVDSSEAFILRELDMNALLMVPLRVAGSAWGLVELYEMRLRRFTEDDVAVAEFLTTHAERRLAAVASADIPRPRPPLYSLPSSGEARRGPRTR